RVPIPIDHSPGLSRVLARARRPAGLVESAWRRCRREDEEGVWPGGRLAHGHGLALKRCLHRLRVRVGTEADAVALPEPHGRELGGLQLDARRFTQVDVRVLGVDGAARLDPAPGRQPVTGIESPDALTLESGRELSRLWDRRPWPAGR